MRIDIIFFKKVQVVFWMMWWLIAFWTDIVGGLAHLGLLHSSWAPDTNYPFLLASLKMYTATAWLATFFYIGILVWSALCLALFVRASFSLHQTVEKWFEQARTAFIVSLTYWMAFFIADQAVMKFDLEENHMVQGGFQLLSFLSLYLLPNHDTTQDSELD